MSNKNLGIRLSGFTDQMFTDISNIANNKGISVSDFLKPLIREIVRKYPAEARANKATKQNKKAEIKVYGIAEVIKQDLENVCGNLGIDTGNFLKVHLYEMIKDYPATLKQAPKSY